MTDTDRGPALITGATDEQNPWPGLEAFREADEKFFYGRAGPISELTHAILRHRLVVLYGRSGLGKTSLLRAGVFPNLRRAKLLPVYVRVDFRTLNATSGLSSLRLQVKAAIEAASLERGILAPPMDPALTLWEWFYRTDARFCTERSHVVQPVLVFDQCEEAFTHGREQGRSPVTDQFIDDIVDLVRGSVPSSVAARLKVQPSEALAYSRDRDVCHVVVSLRREFLSDLLTLRSRLPTLLDHRVELRGMTREEAEEVVTGPGGDLVEEHVEKDIVRAVTAARRSEADLSGDEAMVDPAILSVVCRELNRRRQAEGLAKITAALVENKYDTIIAEFYAESVRNLGTDVERFIEEELITRSGNRGSVALDDALDKPGVTPDVVAALVDRRLIRREGSGSGLRLELTHDVLTDPIMARRNVRREQDQRQEDALREEAKRLVAEQAARRAREAEELAMAKREAAANALLLETKRQANVRQRRFLVAVAALLVVTAVALTTVFVMWRRSIAANSRAQSNLASAHIEQAMGLAASGRRDQALAYVAQAMRAYPDSATARSLAIDAVMYANWPLPIARLEHGGPVLWAEFNRASSHAVTVSKDQTARLWTVPDGRAVGDPLRHGGAVLLARFSRDQPQLLTIATDGFARLWDVNTGRELQQFAHPNTEVTWAAFAPDTAIARPGTGLVVTGAADGSIRIWTNGVARAFTGHGGALATAQFSPDGAYLLTASADYSGGLFDWRTGKRLKTFSHDDAVTAAQFSPDGEIIATSSRDGTTKLWDDDGALLSTLRHQGAVWSAQFNADGTRVITACNDGVARIWDTSNGLLVGSALVHSGPVVSGFFGALSQVVVTGSLDQTARIWDATDGYARGEPLRHTAPLQSAVMSGDAQYVVTSSDDGAAWLWDVRLGSAIPATLWLPNRPAAAAFSADGRSVLVTMNGTQWEAWDGLAAATKPAVKIAEPGPVVTAVSPDGQLMVTAAADGRVRTWQVADGRQVAESKQESEVRSVEFSVDSSLVVSRDAAGTGRIWDARSGRTIHDLRGPLLAVRIGRRPFLSLAASDQTARTATITDVGTDQTVASIAQDAAITEALFGPDGHTLATLAADGKARLWDVATGQLIGTVADDGRIIAAAFSRDGRRLATGSTSGSVRVWDVRTGQPHTASLGRGTAIETVRFSSDGQRLLGVSAAGTISLWEVPTGEAADVPILASMIEALTGYGFNDLRALSRVPDRLERLATERAAAQARSNVSMAERLRAWALASRASRTIAPFSTVTIDAYVRGQVTEPDGFREALDRFPWHPGFDPAARSTDTGQGRQ